MCYICIEIKNQSIMKKSIIIAFVVLVFSSCSVTYSTSVKGDITWMNAEGQVVEKWNSAEIQSEIVDYTMGTKTTRKTFPYKNGGWLEFSTSNNEKVSINGGLIKISNIYSITKSSSDKKKENEIAIASLLEERKELIEIRNSLKKEIKKIGKKDPQYKTKSEELIKITSKINEIEIKLSRDYDYSVGIIDNQN